MKKYFEFWVNNAPLHIKKQIENFSDSEIESHFNHELEFGTAGVRAELGIGSSKMNEYTVSKFAVGYGRFLLEKYPTKLSNGIVIFHDNRKNSDLFTLKCAKVISALGIKVFLYEKNILQPTPLISFAIKHLNAIGGIMITASHNPENYNGLKMYDPYGTQLLENDCKKISKNTNDVKNIFSIDENENNIVFLDDKILNDYLKKLDTIVFSRDFNNVNVTFTPLHGTTTQIVSLLPSRYKFNLNMVEEQSYPSTTFENVSSPNPEDLIAFDKAQYYALKNNSDCIIATDPDGDRLGVMIKHNGEYTQLDGNQQGILQSYFLLDNCKKKYPYIVTTIVSSKLINNICQKYGATIFRTLTGFKYIGNLIRDKVDLDFVYAFEESYGSIVKPFVGDKDSIQSLLNTIEMISFYKKKNLTLIDVLNDIYNEFGFSIEKSIAFDIKSDYEKKKILHKINNFYNDSNSMIIDKKIINRSNYNLGVDDLPKANIYSFTFDSGEIIFRPSGTEPKIRVYIFINCPIKKDSIELFSKTKKWLNKTFI